MEYSIILTPHSSFSKNKKKNLDEYDCFLGSMFCYPIIAYPKFKIMYEIKYNKERECLYFADTCYQQ